MGFKIDNQTISDIELFSQKTEGASIFKFYDKTKTIGGQQYLFKIMNTPFSDIEFLETRKLEVNLFYKINRTLLLKKRNLDFIEYYLDIKRMPLKNTRIDSLTDNLANKLNSNSDFYTIREGIVHLSRLLYELREYLISLNDFQVVDSLKEKYKFILNFLDTESLKRLLAELPEDYRSLKARQVNELDNLFRERSKNDLRKVLDVVYEIDVYQSLSSLLENDHFCLPEYSKEEGPVFEVVDFIHPLLENPIQNSFMFHNQCSLCLVTGPNMSGKSTFLKSLGILTYLAHLGIPVPARKMKTSIYGGLFTTINLSDNINQGFSHFFAEVNRVKKMASILQGDTKLVVILDELFRGTNVTDAYDGTLMIIESLSKIKGSIFIISTHILEAVEKLMETKNIDFKCFESILDSGSPKYDYKLKSGLTTERMGMKIIFDEGIHEILTSIIEKQK